MRNKPKKVPTVRLRNSYVTTVVSISLVLLLLGLLGLILLNAQKISDYVRENIGFTVILKQDVTDADVVQMKIYFDASPAVKESTVVPAQQAAEELQKELGENFLEFLGENPLHTSIDLKLKAAYANTDSISKIEKQFTEFPQVEEVYYQESMVHLVNENLRKISLVILVFSALLFLISVALFNNTIRLMVYSKRFIIKTMQMVGATRKFIRRPFMLRGMMNGILGSAVAAILLMGLIYIGRKKIPELLVFTDLKIIAFLIAGIFVAGLILTWLTTVLAVNKFLGMQRDNLYY
jgi:cell division transport system permease protein